VVADIGSGTGKSSELFLRNGNPVLGVEPNAPMREAAERLLGEFPKFRSVTGTAEATTLSAASVDYVVAGQAFHWFDRPRARAEFARILRPGGWVVLMWYTRRLDSTPFLKDYEALHIQYGVDYREVQHKNITADVLAAWFAGGQFQARKLDYHQRFDFEGLKGRLLSSSFMPTESHPDHGPMLARLGEVFDAHQQAGQACIEYDVELYWGHVG
jgi:SAM-dependent methyltransferase